MLAAAVTMALWTAFGIQLANSRNASLVSLLRLMALLGTVPLSYLLRAATVILTCSCVARYALALFSFPTELGDGGTSYSVRTAPH